MSWKKYNKAGLLYKDKHCISIVNNEYMQNSSNNPISQIYNEDILIDKRCNNSEIKKIHLACSLIIKKYDMCI